MGDHIDAVGGDADGEDRQTPVDRPLQGGSDPGPFRRAQRDFAARHPGRWIPKLRERLEGQDPMPFFRELVSQLERFLAHDQQRLVALVGPTSD